ncbi:BSP-domain-containing protein [Lophiostoma macrostomum CBS 122681]|uniref:BSP-domain-containing protein n=1 Tax=Lophiostoma macrostomum CBS 122681 TaxID=1314788 RepID=A0A6A6TH25_9PLEO|nr:BSP-domain-containing protein [Lophiostoma macrostomum CBS 122681]
MTSAAPAPQSSAMPPSQHPISSSTQSPQPATSDHSPVKPHRKPLLRLEIRDLTSPGARSFLRLLHASSSIEDAVSSVLRLLYSGLPRHCIPPTRSVTLVIRSMGGVAYTTGSDIDGDHKEIHFSTDYISHVPEARQKEEMEGVIVHEMVHCWQHSNGAPGGLIEGIADWVRLKAGYAPPHWRRHADGQWDSGYERTGYFLEWLEKEHGEDVVRRINECLRQDGYDEEPFWEKCCGKSVSKLWEEYRASLGHADEHQRNDKADSGRQDSAEKNEAEHVETPETGESSTLGEPAEAGPDNELDADKHKDTRSARVKARRGGNMHVPVRPLPDI